MANVAGEMQRARAVLCRLEQEIAKLAPHPGKKGLRASWSRAGFADG